MKKAFKRASFLISKNTVKKKTKIASMLRIRKHT